MQRLEVTTGLMVRREMRDTLHLLQDMGHPITWSEGRGVLVRTFLIRAEAEPMRLLTDWLELRAGPARRAAEIDHAVKAVNAELERIAKVSARRRRWRWLRRMFSRA